MKRWIVILFAMLITGIFYLGNSIPPYDGLSKEETARMGPDFRYFSHTVADQNMHGAVTGDKAAKAVIFIHGTPGDWRAWGDYLGDTALKSKAFMIAVDRPGFGLSGRGKTVVDLKAQASAIIAAALVEHPGPFLLVGHSYGGPIQVQMAADFPEHVSGIIMLAGAIDPVLQKARWYHHLGGTWLGRAAISDVLEASTDEMLALPAQLQDQRDALSKLGVPITIIQGETDWLVPAGNAAYARANIASANIIEIKGQGHFLPWEQYPLVKAQILKHLDDQE